MHPTLVTIKVPQFLQGLFGSELAIHSYGLMIAIGILVGFLITLRMTKRYGVDTDKLSNLFLWVILAAFVGGKFFFLLEDTDRYLSDPAMLKRVMGGGFVFYGSVIFAIPTIIWWLRRNKVPAHPFFDVLAFVGPVVHSFGRIGCFLAGCCHGKVCDTWMGVVYTREDSLADPLNTPLYPTQFFDIAVNIVIILTLLIFRKKQQFKGQLFLIYLIMYGVGRSIVELYRGDEERGFVLNGLLSHSQLIALIIIGVCAYFWLRWRKDPKLRN